MAKTIDISEFILVANNHRILDVRTNAEYEQGHFPGAENIPLFSNEERAIVGTIYKKEGKQKAVLKGLELVGPRMSEIVQTILEKNNSKKILLYCWRGGMRSNSVAWLLEQCGIQTVLLKGGYKQFRKKVLSSFENKKNILVLGGKTGSSKTDVLHLLKEKGEQVIDLEKLANHKGSAFGGLGEEMQPSQEMFENNLFWSLSQLNPSNTIWIEDESRLIGKKIIPEGLWTQMRSAPVAFIDLPKEERINYLVMHYGKFSAEELKKSIAHIQKRLGGLDSKIALEGIDKNDLYKTCEISLKYYDKAYEHGLSKRDTHTIKKHCFEKINLIAITDELIKLYGNKTNSV